MVHLSIHELETLKAHLQAKAEAARKIGREDRVKQVLKDLEKVEKAIQNKPIELA